jgi:putative flippase GtrA
MKKLVRFMIVGLFAATVLPVTLSAYIDPGTGSYILQLLIAAFVGISFTIKLFWKKIKKFFSPKKAEKTETPDGK